MRSSTDGIRRAERAVIRAAMGIVNKEGWAFDKAGTEEYNVVLFPKAMRRLEFAIQRLGDERIIAKRMKRATRS